MIARTHGWDPHVNQVLISTIYFIDAGATSCPCGWDSLNSTCYYFSKFQATWDNARSYCLSRGADLAFPVSREEEMAILDALEIKKHKDYHPWIGLVRRYDKEFFTVYGLKPNYTNWLPGEPDNFSNCENCAHYWVKNGKQAWNDILCAKKNHFICEDKRMKRELKRISVINLSQSYARIM